MSNLTLNPSYGLRPMILQSILRMEMDFPVPHGEFTRLIFFSLKMS